MTKRAALAFAMLVAAFPFGSALADAPTSASGAGMLTDSGGRRTFAFSAIEVDGVVQGQAQIDNRGLGFVTHVDIDCLKVVGNTAVISGVITKSNVPGIEGTPGVFAVQDNGEGKNAAPDRLSLFYYNYSPVYNGTLCEHFVFGNFTTRPIEAGNIQVRP